MPRLVSMSLAPGKPPSLSSTFVHRKISNFASVRAFAARWRHTVTKEIQQHRSIEARPSAAASTVSFWRNTRIRHDGQMAVMGEMKYPLSKRLCFYLEIKNDNNRGIATITNDLQSLIVLLGYQPVFGYLAAAPLRNLAICFQSTVLMSTTGRQVTFQPLASAVEDGAWRRRSQSPPPLASCPRFHPPRRDRREERVAKFACPRWTPARVTAALSADGDVARP